MVGWWVVVVGVGGSFFKFLLRNAMASVGIRENIGHQH